MKLTAFLTLALVSSAARAAVVPVRLPSLAVLPPMISAAPVSLTSPALSASPSLAAKPLPLIPAVLPAPVLPSPSAGLPLIVPARLPGVKNPLPLPQTLQASSPISSHDDVHLDWSFLDGGAAAAPVKTPRPRGPKPLPPAGAAAQLKFASDGAKKGLVRVGADPLFDHAHALAELGID